MDKLTTKIDKGFLTTLCADAISELDRAARMFPQWPTTLTKANTESIQAELTVMRDFNAGDKATPVTIFGEEFFEFLEAAKKPGNHVAAYRELVQALAMLLRVGLHLDDYVTKSETGNSKLETGEETP